MRVLLKYVNRLFNRRFFIKIIFAFFFIAVLAGASLAQDQIHQQLPQADTTSGWQLVFSNPRYFIVGLQYFPENTVYAVASNKSILILMRSYNGGISWDTLSTPIPTGDVTFTSVMTGYSSSDDPRMKFIWKTTDGGNSWQPHDRPSIASGRIAFADKDTGIVFGSGQMARTTNAGETWKEINWITDLVITDASFSNSKVGYAVGDAISVGSNPYAGWCQKTTDGGATWKFIYTGIPADINCCEVLDEKTVVVACNSYFVGRTTDGGNTWDSTRLVSRKTDFLGMSFANKAHGIIVGDDDNQGINPHGIIYVTTDTAKTWQKQYAPKEATFTSVLMIDDNIAIITGDGGKIYRTINGGNFSSVAQHTIDFHVQTFPNPNTGIVTIQYQLPSPQAVAFSFYNIQGVTVGDMNLGLQEIGTHQTIFDGSNLANGMYYFHLTTPQDSFTGSFTIQK